MDQKTYQILCSQLSSRPSNIETNWNDNARRLEIFKIINGALENYSKWPNSSFIPEDPFEIVVWDHSACLLDDLLIDEALLAIENRFQVKPPHDFWRRCLSLTYGQVIDEFINLIDAAAQDE